MRIEVNGTRLFFEVCGTTLRMDDPPGRERPSLIVLHGGPGFDHAGFRNYFDRLSDAVQVIYLDQRGDGDLATPPDGARELARGIGGHCELEILPEAKHGAFRDEPAAFDAAIRRFLMKLAG